MTITPPVPEKSSTPASGVKPGYLTTEFWLQNAAQVFLTLNTVGVWTYVHPQWVSLVTQGAVLGAYQLSRGWAKSNTGTK